MSVSPPIIMRSVDKQRFSSFASGESVLSTNHLLSNVKIRLRNNYLPFLKYFENTPSLSSFFVNSGDLLDETLAESSLLSCNSLS